MVSLHFHIVSVGGHRDVSYGKTDEEDKRVFMETHGLISDVNVLYVLSVTGLAP